MATTYGMKNKPRGRAYSVYRGTKYIGFIARAPISEVIQLQKNGYKIYRTRYIKSND